MTEYGMPSVTRLHCYAADSPLLAALCADVFSNSVVERVLRCCRWMCLSPGSRSI